MMEHEPSACGEQTHNTIPLHQRITSASVSRRRLLHTVGTGSLIGVVGCAGRDPADSAGLQPNVTIAIDGLTPGTAEVWGGVTSYFTNILEPLVWVSEEMGTQPWLAEDWERTGELTFEFSIRDGVSFHNGEPLTADEVIWSTEVTFEAMPWTKTGWQVDEFRKVDDMTVEFTTSTEFPSFPGAIAHNHLAIQHPDANRGENEVIGTGPYQVEDIELDQYVKTSVFEDYWGGAAQTDQITFREAEDANTRALLLQGGEVHVAFDPPRGQVASLAEADETDVVTQLSPSAVWVAINTELPPTNDLRLREALNYAVSQAEIVETVMEGIGQPARGPIAPVIPWSAHDDLPEYGPDMDRASDLVAQTDYQDETLTFAVETDQPVDGDIMAQVIQQNASDIGVDIDIVMMESAAFSDALEAGNDHLFLRSFGTNSAAADYVLSQLFWTGGASSYWYDFGDKFDDLIIKGLGSGDLQVKQEVYGEAQQILMEEAAILPLFYEEYVIAFSSNIDGLDLRPIPEMSRWTELRRYEQ